MTLNFPQLPGLKIMIIHTVGGRWLQNLHLMVLAVGNGLGMPGHRHYGGRAGVSYLYVIYIRCISNVTVFMNILKKLRGIEPVVEPVRYIVTEGAYAPEDLPLRDGPLRFAVMSSDGASSESWSVTVTNLGDVYIVCREVDLDIKVSLHESGLQKIAYRGIWREANIGYDQRWQEHRHYTGDSARPSFTLMFPNFGLSLDEEWRQAHPRTWSARHVLLRAAQRPLATLIAFAITDDNVGVMERVGYAVIAEIPTRPGKKLCVIAGYTPERNVSRMLQNGLEEMMRESSPEDFSASLDGPFRVFGLRIAKEGGPWLLCLPVQLDRVDVLGTSTELLM